MGLPTTPGSQASHLLNPTLPVPHRGETRLDGAWAKKQVWRPRDRTWGLSEANTCIEESRLLVTLLGLFDAPCNDLAPRSDSASGELCSPLIPRRYVSSATTPNCPPLHYATLFWMSSFRNVMKVNHSTSFSKSASAEKSFFTALHQVVYGV